MSRSVRTHAITLATFAVLGCSLAYGQGCTGTTTLTCAPANGTLTVPANASSSASASITVPSTSASIQTVSLKLNKLTGNPFALAIILVGPGGVGSTQRLVVFDDICGSNNGGDAANSVTNIDLTLADANSTSLPGDAATCTTGMPTGNYKPTVSATNPDGSMPTVGAITSADRAQPSGSATFASRFTGNPTGTWTVYAGLVCGPGCGTPTLGNSSTPAFTLTLVLNASAASTSTALTSSVNPAFSTAGGNATTYTATVTSTATVNAGSVTFKDGSTTICNAVAVNGSGVATCPISYTNANTEGVHLISASYSGTASFSTSTSNTITQVVRNHSTNPVLTTTSAQFCNPGGVSLPATGATGSPTGTPGSVYPSEIQVTGVAGLIQNVQVQLLGFSSSNPEFIAYMLQGPNSKALSFMSFAGFTSSVGPFTVNIDDTASSLIPFSSSITGGTWKPSNYTNAGSAQPDSYCQSVVCNGVTVAAAAPATIDVAPPSPGGKTLVQEFGGISPNGNWNLFGVERGNPGSGAITSWCLNFTLTAGTSTTTTVASSLNPALTSQPAGTVILTATVTPSSGTVNAGTVTFTENGVNLAAPVNVVNNVATLDVSTLSEGSHSIVANYSGNATFGPSNGSITQRMDNASTKSISTNVFTYCNPGLITMPAGGAASPIAGIASPYQSKIFTSDLPGSTTKAQLLLNNFAFSQPTQLTSLVSGPSGAALDFLSRTGGVSPVTGLNLVFDDTGSSITTSMTSGTFKPTSATASNTYPSPAPGSFTYAQPAGAGTLALFNNVNNAGTWSLWFNTLLNGAVGSTNWCVKLTQNLPVVTLAKSHSPTNFLRGGTGTYTLHFSNAGPGQTGGQVQIVDTLPAGLTPTAASGSGWTCGIASQTVTCTRADSLASGSAFPDVSVTVNVLNSIATTTVTNSATASGTFGAGSVLTPSDITNIVGNDVSISKSHSGNFAQGQTGATYSITVRNNSGVVTNGTIGVTDNLPAGLTATGFSGSGWTCDALPALHCTLNAALAATTTSPAITLTVTVANTATNLTNQAVVTYANQTGSTTTANDSTTITQTAASVTATSGTPQSTAINTAFGAPLVVTVRDANNATVQGVNVVFTAPGSGASAVFSNSTNTITIATNASGVASAPVSANAFVGPQYTVTAVAGALPAANFLLTNTSGAASGMTANPNTTPQTTAVNTAFPVALSVTVRDAGSNPVSGFNVTFTAPASGPSGTFSNSTNTITVATNASGVASAPFTANATAGAQYTVAATGSGVSTVNFLLTNTAGSGSSMTANSGTTPQTAAVNTAYANALAVTVKDSGNNPVSGFNVTFTAPASGASGIFSNSTNTITVATNASGIASAPFTANSTAGPQYTVTATGSGVSTVNFLLTNTAGAASTMTINPGGTPQSTAINTAFANALAVTVKDAGNNPVSGFNVTFTAPGSGASGLFSNSTTTITVATNASGVASAPFTANATAGSYTVAASGSGVTTVNFSLTNTSGSGSSMTANGGSTPQVTTVNSAFPNAVAVTVKDAGNNPVSGFNVTFTAPASGPSAIFSNTTNTITVATNASGIASAPVTANTIAGPQYAVTASGSGVSPVTFLLTNNPAAAAVITVSSGAGQSATVSTLFAAPLVALVKDTFGNVVPGVTVTFTGPGAGAGISPSPVTANTNASGLASTPVTANATAGSYNVVASSGVATTANFGLTNTTAGSALLTGRISGASGPKNARMWSVEITNNGPGTAANTIVTAFSLTQTGGAACTPVIVTPLPASVGTLSSGGVGVAPITIDFTGCVAAARFRLTVNFSANAGVDNGTFTLNNQFQ